MREILAKNRPNLAGLIEQAYRRYFAKTMFIGPHRTMLDEHCLRVKPSITSKSVGDRNWNNMWTTLMSSTVCGLHTIVCTFAALARLAKS